MLYLVYAVRSVNSWSWYGRDREGWINFVFGNDVRVVDEKERDGFDVENDVENTSGYEKPGVRPARLGWEELVSVYLHTRSGLVPSVSGKVNWLAHKILLSRTFSWWFRPSPLISHFVILDSTIT